MEARSARSFLLDLLDVLAPGSFLSVGDEGRRFSVGELGTKTIRERANFAQRKYYQRNRLKILAKAKLEREKNLEKYRKRCRGYRLKNREAQIRRCKIWRSENKEKVRKQNWAYISRRMKEDPGFKVSRFLRSRLWRIIKTKRVGSFVKDLGCTIDQLCKHLENQFYPDPNTGENMTWENYGEWHIDHIRPLCSFDLMSRSDFLLAANFLNLRPLWKSQNLAKVKDDLSLRLRKV